MSNIETKIQEKAKELLEKEQVAVVIGWGQGWNPAKATPTFARDTEGASKLKFDAFCFNNLAVYLPRMGEKAAIITKPCEAGSIVALLAEGKIARDNVYIVSVACPGVVDRIKLEKAVGSVDEATAAYVDGADIVVEVGGEAKRVPLAKVALDACAACDQSKVAEIADETVGDATKPVQAELESVVPEDADSAWWREFWTQEFDKCIRCYACREACPACYCRDNCAVQALRERWTGSNVNPMEALMFHAQRAMHVAGRCIECGACERACPVGIPLTLLHNQVGSAVKKLFNFNVGEKVDERPPLETFQKEEL